MVYADAAAESYSAWSMLTACECHEMLKEWDKAEQFIRAVAERYDGEQFEWMLWCYRTGHGDTDAADQCARASTSRCSPRRSTSTCARRSAFITC